MQGNAHKNPGPGTGNASLRVIREGFPDRPAFGTAVSEAILTRVASGDLAPTFRLHRPAREVAFAKQDRAADGFANAVAAAHDAGFDAVVRLAGGRAALFHEGTLAFAWASADGRPTAHTHDRFALIAEVVAAALRNLGVDARIGEVPGEYCPGAWSVNARGALKLAGIGQRIVAGGAHVGGVLVVTDGALLRETLTPVYSALGLDWDPATAGAVEDEAPGVTLDDSERALLDELGRRFELTEASIDPATLAMADGLAADHEAR